MYCIAVNRDCGIFSTARDVPQDIATNPHKIMGFFADEYNIVPTDVYIFADPPMNHIFSDCVREVEI